ncbi:hypothetical protein L484_015179 [Morus notabilis]|uniref:Uncharacterized protein n=1 Tax=Morus notabilis TaxID=981085 RepID=W9SB42_9ROSA|nr:hypothetical protein L484_015179 [Morus notabilis]
MKHDDLSFSALYDSQEMGKTDLFRRGRRAEEISHRRSRVEEIHLLHATGDLSHISSHGRMCVADNGGSGEFGWLSDDESLVEVQFDAGSNISCPTQAATGLCSKPNS